MVSGDVFRPPGNATLLCVQLGSGVQIILSSFITLFFAALGASHQLKLPSCHIVYIKLSKLSVFASSARPVECQSSIQMALLLTACHPAPHVCACVQDSLADVPEHCFVR